MSLPQVELKYSLSTSCYFLIIYMISLTLLLIIMSNTRCTKDINLELIKINQLSLFNLTDSNRRLLAILLLFIGGIPPFALFLAKFSIFVNLISSCLSLNSSLFSFYGIIENLTFNYYYSLVFILLIVLGMGVGLYVYIIIVARLMSPKTTLALNTINFKSSLSLFTAFSLIYITIEGPSIFNFIKLIVT